MGRRRVLVALAWACFALAAGSAEAKRVRVFAVQPKLDVGRWLDSREHFRAKFFALFDRGLRGMPGTPLVQRGAGDVASHLLGPSDPSRPVETARDLVALPEDAGLWSILAGVRGAGARSLPAVPNAFALAVASVAGTYAPQVAHYASTYPQLASRTPQGRLLVVALTDQIARVAVETFAELADRYDVWLEAGMNMARDWRVVCTDMAAFNSARPPRLPGGERCAVEDPARVALLRGSEEPFRDYAYEATTPDAVNMGLVFDPDGRIVSRQVKAYLTPPELPGLSLDLRPGPAAGLRAVPTPVGRLGVVTSKDAWMPDVIDRLDADGVEILIQPEYFLGNLTVPQGSFNPAGIWNPDVLLASGPSALLRSPSMEAMALPQLVGNMLDASADHQSQIVTRVRSKRTSRVAAMVGQPSQRGFAAMSPWVVPDPAEAPYPERRARLAAAGARLLPDSTAPCADPAEPGPCANGHVEDVVFHDVEVGRRPAYRRYRGPFGRTVFGHSRPLGHSRSPQRAVSLSTRGRTVAAGFEEGESGASRIRLAISRDGGRRFRRVATPAPTPAWSQRGPAIAVSAGRVLLAWAEEHGAESRIKVAVSRNGRRFSVPRAVGAAEGSRQERPSLAPAPGGGAYLVYLDDRDRSVDDDLPQAHVRFARVNPAGEPGETRRLDGGQPVELAAKLDNAWAPIVASRGDRVAVSWLDFRTYDWRPYLRMSGDGGSSWGPERAVSSNRAMDPNGTWEQGATAPSLALAGEQPLVAWSDWRKLPGSLEKPSTAYDAWLASGQDGGEDVRVDGHGDRQESAFSPSVLAVGADAIVAFQDSAGANGDIRAVRIRSGIRPGRRLRVDDTGRGGSNQYRPAVARAGRHILVCWEDERNGPRQVYCARAPLSRIR
jgi:predicted amidohydrolase